MAGRFEHADKRGCISTVEVTVSAHRVITYFFDVVAGMKQLQAVEAGCHWRLQRQLSIEAQAQQFSFKRLVALRAEGMSVFKTVVGKRLTEINTGVSGRHDK